MIGRTHDVCAFEATLALMSAALRVVTLFTRDGRPALALWRGHAGEARELLRLACEAAEPGQIVLEVAA